MRRTLLVPQHWSQVSHGVFSYKGTNDGIKLSWNNSLNVKTVHLDPVTNTPSFCLAPGSSGYLAFEAIFNNLNSDLSQGASQQVSLTFPSYSGTLSASEISTPSAVQRPTHTGSVVASSPVNPTQPYSDRPGEGTGTSC